MITTNEEKELKEIYTSTKDIFNKMGMNLREYQMNSTDARKSIPEMDRAKDDIVKLLGHMWNSTKDTLTIKIPKPPENVPTKREIVSFLASIYDPMGMLSPITVPLKEVIQDLWQEEISWKEKIPGHAMKKWETIKATFEETNYTMQRRLVQDYNYEKVQLLIFSDASERHFAITAYLHFEFNKKKPITKLIMSKSKVKPKSTEISIPRLELMGIEIAVNAAITLEKELAIKKLSTIKFFSDSMIALYWVLKREKLTKFVDNRVSKIHEKTTLLKQKNLKPTFHHCPTDQNPADIASRGSTIAKLMNNKLWEDGPEFLKLPQSEWPIRLEGTISYPTEFRELIEKEVAWKKQQKPKTRKSTVLTVSPTEQEPQSIVRYKTARSFDKLTTTMAMVLRWFVRKFPDKKWNTRIMTKLQKLEKSEKQQTIHAIENQIKQRKVIREYIISDHYQDQKRRGNLAPKGLELIEDESGVLRHPRDLDNSKLPFESKHPIYLVKNHTLTDLIVRDIHRENAHLAPNHMTGAVLQKYWIPKLGTVIRKITQRCYRCRKQTGHAFQYPYSKILPTCRTIPASPFSHVGLDYFGPILYTNSRGKSNKTWVMLITCLVTRAVHLELVPDNSTITYLMAMKRYFGRRGVPKSILCDNAPAFKLGNKMINDEIRNSHHESQTLTTFLAAREIELKYITPLSPWQGGIYERIVGIIKNQFYKTISKEELSYVELETVLIEVEAAVNSRPITKNSANPDDPIALRPIDFLIPNVCLTIPDNSNAIQEITTEGQVEKLTREYQNGLNKLYLKLWDIWNTQYLLNLKESKTKRHNYTSIKPKKGQLVLIHTENMARHKWPIAQITKLDPSADGKIRSVFVKCGKKELKRSIRHLIPLEVGEEEMDHQETDKTIPEDDSILSQPQKSNTETKIKNLESTETIQNTRERIPRKAKQPIDYNRMNEGIFRFAGGNVAE
uniref:Integrase catalytic domain-containing protein n=1 Tax=Caenorhabditis japonica TaxID=281687 RepID=A0A8R1EGV9_CAEJA